MYISTDVDECSMENGGCEHECQNTPGSFTCSCRSGYLLVDSVHCDSKFYEFTLHRHFRFVSFLVLEYET